MEKKEIFQILQQRQGFFLNEMVFWQINRLIVHKFGGGGQRSYKA